jgi:hypothetical protein
LQATLAQVGLALGGRAGERISHHLAAPVSRTTLLRLVRGLPDPAAGSLRVVGVDEFALRRGHTYGTVLVNMVTHRPVDVLADRCANTLAAWLQDHPDVEVICRDRAGPYADGATRGALQATQVADRWHLLHNLADVVERVAKRHRAALRDDPDPTQRPVAAVTVVEGPRATTTRQRYAQVHALADRGINLTTICQRLGLDPKTVRRYQRAASPEELLAPAAQRATALDAHKPYLARRFGDGYTNAAWLWDELRDQGYRGSRRSVRRYLNTLAASTARPNPLLPPLPVRTFRRLVLRLWGAEILIHHAATCSYSWMRPPSTSRRSTSRGSTCGDFRSPASGAANARPRCGRCWL